MAADPEFIDTWAHGPEGPWLHHLCRSSASRDRILSEGLLCAQPSTYTGTALASRPEHVYLVTGRALGRIAQQLGIDEARDPDLIITVDARALDSAALSPDEDCCFDSWIADEGIPMPGAPSPLETVRDDLAGWEAMDADDPAAFAARPYRSYGQWAQAVDLGCDVEHTRRCWEQVGSLAHRGPIAATLLTAGLADVTAQAA